MCAHVVMHTCPSFNTSGNYPLHSGCQNSLCFPFEKSGNFLLFCLKRRMCNLDYNLCKTGLICFFKKNFWKTKKSAWEREVNSDVQFEVKAKVSKEA